MSSDQQQLELQPQTEYTTYPAQPMHPGSYQPVGNGGVPTVGREGRNEEEEYEPAKIHVDHLNVRMFMSYWGARSSV